MRKKFKTLGLSLMIGGIFAMATGFGTPLPKGYNEILFIGGGITLYLGVIILGIILFRS